MIYIYKDYYCYKSLGFELLTFSLAELIQQMKTIYKLDITNLLN